MRITRMSLMLVLISMLSGCCCLWYVAVDEPEVYSKQKSKVKTNTVQNPVTKKKPNKMFPVLIVYITKR